MGQLLLAAAGAAVGGLVAGPTGASIGWSLGSVAGSALFTPRSDRRGPRLSTLDLTTSTYGVALPEVHGTAPCAGNVIWAAPLKEHENTQRIGKGGGGTVTTYTYTADFVVALCGGPIAAVRRIWANEKLVYDVGDNADAPAIAGTGKLTDNIRVYLGTASQQPSALIESYEGVGNVPGYRGVALCEFSDFQLAEYGNMLPTLKFEVVRDGTVVCPRLVRQYTSLLYTTGTTSVDALQPTGAELSGDAIFIRSNNYPYEVGEPSNTSQRRVRESVISAVSDTVLKNAYEYLKEANTGGLKTGTCPNDVHWTTIGQSITGDLFFQSDSGTVIVDAINYPPPPLTATAGNPFVVLKLEGAVYAYRVGISGFSSVRRQLIQMPDGSPPPGTMIASSIGAVGTWVDISAHDCIAADAENNWIIVAPLGGNRLYVVDAITMQIRATFDNRLTISGILRDIYPIAAAGGRAFCWYQVPGSPSITYAAVIDTTPIGGTLASPLTLTALQTSAIDLGTGISPWCIPGPGLVMIGPRLYSYLDSIAAASPTLQQVVERIATVAGYDAPEVDATDLASISVKGFRRDERMTGTDQIGLLAAAYSFDVAEIDGKLVGKRRGATSIATIVRDDLLSVGDAVVQSIRAQESELPRQIDLSYMSHGADYAIGSQSAQRIVTVSTQKLSVDVPIVLGDADAASMVARMLWESWIGRTRRSFELGPKHSKLVPTDVITLPLSDQGDTAIIRLTSVKRDGIRVRCEGVDVDAAAFTQPSVGGAVPGGSSGAFIAQPMAEIYPLDLPPLRDTDDDYGIYVAVSTYSSIWRGAEVFGRQNSGADWLDLATATERCTMGTAATVLADSGCGDGQYDTIAMVDIDFVMGPLPSSMTIDGFLASNDNAFLIGDEIIRARTVTTIFGNRVRLSNLIRGLAGTGAARSTHVVHERAVWLHSSIRDVGHPASWLNQSGTAFAAVSVGAAFASRRETPLTLTGRRLKPLPPAHLRAIRLANDDVLFLWIRRARIFNTWSDGADVPLDEPFETYDVEVWNAANTAVIRTFGSLSSPQVTYTKAQIAADFGDYSQNAFNVRVYQISARVGRGVPASKALVAQTSGQTIAYLKFEGANGSTSITDETGRAWTARGNAQIDNSIALHSGGACLFDGTGDAIDTPHDALFSFGDAAFTIEAFVRMSVNPSTFFGIISKHASGIFGEWDLIIDNGRFLRFDATSNGSSWGLQMISPSALAINTTYKVAVSRSGSSWKLLINDVVVDSKASNFTIMANASPIVVGAGDTAYGASLNGRLDEVRVVRNAALY